MNIKNLLNHHPVFFLKGVMPDLFLANGQPNTPADLFKGVAFSKAYPVFVSLRFIIREETSGEVFFDG